MVADCLGCAGERLIVRGTAEDPLRDAREAHLRHMEAIDLRRPERQVCFGSDASLELSKRRGLVYIVLLQGLEN